MSTEQSNENETYTTNQHDDELTGSIIAEPDAADTEDTEYEIEFLVADEQSDVIEIDNQHTSSITQEATASESDDDNAATDSDEAPAQFSAVDINIIGRPYTINCPVGDEEELHSATDYINTFIDDIQQHMPNLSHENLLVLCCLNLYEQIQQAKKSATENDSLIQQATSMVTDMVNDISHNIQPLENTTK